MKKNSIDYDPELSEQQVWYAVANRSRADLFKEEGTEFVLVERVLHPEGRIHESSQVENERTTGLVGGSGTHHGLGEDRFQEVLGKKFAKRIVKILSTAFEKKRFNKLILVAEPRFLGWLRAELPQSLQKALKREFIREYPQITSHELKKLVIAGRAEEAKANLSASEYLA